MIAGVAGGLAESTGIPPLIVRLLFAVSATFVVGLIVYAVAWAVLPMDTDVRAGEPNHVFGRLLVAAGITLAVIVLPLGGILTASTSRLAFPAMLILIGLAMISRNHDRQLGASTGPVPGPITGPPAGLSTMPPPDANTGDIPPGQPHTAQVPGVDAYGNTSTITYGADPTTQIAAAPPIPRRQRPSLRFPYLGLLTWSTVLVVLGAIAATTVLGGPVVGPGPAIALALIVFSAGLIVSAFRGRARGLILPILALTALLGTLAVVDVQVNTVERPFELVATTSADLPDEVHSTTGTSKLDLTNLKLDENRAMQVRVNFGTLRVDLPMDTTVVVKGHVGMGNSSSYTYDRPMTAMTTGIQKRWIADGVPEAGSPIDRELLSDLPNFGYGMDSFGTAMDRFYVLRSEDDYGGDGVAVGLDTEFDRGSDHVLTLDIEVGVGTVELIEPVWSTDDWNPTDATQLCTSSDGPTGTVMPCGDVTAALRVPLCINDNGYLVDCRTDRPATPDSPRIAACLDMLGENVDCSELGIEAVGAKLVGPTEKVTKDDPTDSAVTNPDTSETPEPPDAGAWTTQPTTDGEN